LPKCGEENKDSDVADEFEPHWTIDQIPDTPAPMSCTSHELLMTQHKISAGGTLLAFVPPDGPDMRPAKLTTTKHAPA